MSVYVGVRDVVTVSGSDAASYLQGQISQDVDTLAEGVGSWSFILQPQGKVDAWFRITRSGDRFLLDVDEGWGAALMARLQRFLLRVDVQLDLATWSYHAYRGETATADAPIVLAVEWGDAGTDILGPDLASPDVDRLDENEFTEMRVEAGMPAMTSEISESTIPAAIGVVDLSVSFTKGCYTGQELVARVDSRGNNTPTQLRRLRGNGEMPDAGMSFMIEDDQVGSFTSVAGSDGNWVALGFIKRAHADADTAMTGGGAIQIERVGDFV